MGWDLFGPVTTTQTNTNGNASWLQGPWQNWLQNLQTITPQSMPVYGGPTVAPFNQNQQTAVDMSQQLATNGTPAYNAATSAIQQQAGGVTNPYASATNQYMGADPYTQQVINNVNRDMTTAYQNGTAAQTDAAMARQGAYGGSGYNQLTGLNNQAFANAIGNTDSQLLNQNFYNNSNLAENQLNRETNSFDNTQNRSLQAANLGLGSQGTDLQAIQNLYGMGANQQGNTQSILGAMQNLWNQQTQAPFVSSSILGNGLSQAGGAPTTNTTTLQQPGNSPWGVGGAAILAWLASQVGT